MSVTSSLQNVPKIGEIVKEFSLFDPDTKDSGFSDEFSEERDKIKIVSSPLSLEDEATILCFSPKSETSETTPFKRRFSGKKKRLFISPTESPSILAAGSLKRLRLFDLGCQESSVPLEELPLDFTDNILNEHSDDEVSLASSLEVQKDLMKEAIEKSETEADLIGDFSRSYTLPVIAGCHPDLKSISVNTMKDVIEGKYADILNSVMIIDSRYPYEFEGGHIDGAINIYTKEDCLQLLNKSSDKNERHILIFHCEFSKERGPNMIRSLRQEDRTRNTKNYPHLTYPEIYVLEGGYKRFFETFPQYCRPMEYKQMLHPEHADEMRFFRKKSKTSENILKTNKKKRSPVSRSSRMVRKFLSNDF